MTSRLDNLSRVVRRLCKANQAKILHLGGGGGASAFYVSQRTNVSEVHGVITPFYRKVFGWSKPHIPLIRVIRESDVRESAEQGCQFFIGSVGRDVTKSELPIGVPLLSSGFEHGSTESGIVLIAAYFPASCLAKSRWCVHLRA
jgi:hypothetical protein